MDFAALNQLANASFLPLKKVVDLMDGKAYVVLRFREANTRFGQRVVIDVNPTAVNHDEDFSLFLSKKMSEYLLANTEKYNALKADAVQGKIVMDCVTGPPKSIAFRKL